MKKGTQARRGLAEVVEIRPGAAQSYVDLRAIGSDHVGRK